jgi:hypothetical protein
MTRHQALHKILRVLKNWEGSKLEYRTAKDLLECVEEEIGMLPPALPEDQCSILGLPSYKWEIKKKKGRRK